MNRLSRIVTALLVMAWSYPVLGQSQQNSISSDEIVALNAKLTTATKAASKARKKLAIRRIIREGEALIKTHPDAVKRFEVLNILFKSYQSLLKLDNSTANRKTFLETCKKLATAPDEYAEIRLNADLLLTQAAAARKGANPQGRSDALRPLVERYRNTGVEVKVVRIAMIMALELGNTRLVNDLRQIVAERFPGDRDLISFLREKLATQVFGAPFIGTFEQTNGKQIKFPMDFLGTTTLLYFWSKKDDGKEDIKELAAAWEKAKVEHKAAGRYQIVSMNMDDLPDAGESILREVGVDWLALKMPKGQDNPIYKAYVKRATPTTLTVSSTGYAALYHSGGRRNRTYERNLGSMMSRSWALPRYSSQLQSIFSGEFLVMNSQGRFDAAAPPEYKAVTSESSAKLPRTAASVPEDKLHAIQACFINPPIRYRTPHDQLIANYKKIDALCLAAIAAHPDAPDLWIVRNRRISALMGLWKAGDQNAFADAVAEANTAIKTSYPKGTDIVARLCLARQALRMENEPKAVIKDFIDASGGQQSSGPALTAVALLALDTGDRLQYDKSHRTFLDKHADNPTMLTATAFLLNRYHQYWIFHQPFIAGWTFGRRQGHFLSIGTPEDAKRTFQTELKTLDGETVKIPESSGGKWTVIAFGKGVEVSNYLARYASFTESRPFKDVNLISAILNDNADAVRTALEPKKKTKHKKKPDAFPTLLVPGGMQNPLVRKLGILAEDISPRQRPNVVILRPDGSIAVALSGLTMNGQKGSVIQNVIEWQDEKNIDAALARGDLKEAKRLAFAFAPLKEPTPPDQKKKKRPVKIALPHLRSRAKVYLAMGNLKAAAADIEKAYLAVNIQSGHISMRTEELEETEALKAIILSALKKAESEK
jgi:hypothetical protein